MASAHCGETHAPPQDVSSRAIGPNLAENSSFPKTNMADMINLSVRQGGK